MSSGLPRATVPQDGVEDGEERPQGRDEGDLLGMAGGPKALVEGGEGRIVTGGSESGHIQRSPDGPAAALNHAAAPQRATVPVEGRDPDQGGDLSAIEMSQLREFRNERRRGDRSRARHGPEQVLGLAPRRTGADRV